MRFVHTSDWHIGATFGFADEASQVLRDERLDAITRIGTVAFAQGVRDVLVAGDIYDVETPSDRTLRQPIERMRAAETVQWHLIPGNHDAHTPRGPWERLRRLGEREGLPTNVTLHLEQHPASICEGAAFLLPSVLTRRHTMDDPTAWMDMAATPDGAVRIGLAHGSIADFGRADGQTANLIAPNRPDKAGLAYMALGDYHGALSVSARCGYSGTPEVDGFTLGGDGGGTVSVVEVDGPRALPVVTPHRVGRFVWHREDASLHSATDVDVLENRLRGLVSDLGSVLVWLRVSGALSLEHREMFDSRIRQRLGSALRVLRLDDTALLPQPTAADLAAIDHAGFVRAAADKLAAMADDEASPRRRIAAAALQRLFLLNLQTSEKA
jgi:DNA repair exonuclease SbcCD nuclease subunit